MKTEQDLRRARYERACWWLGQGVPVVPLKPGSKELQPGYGSRSAQITQVAWARKWFMNTDANLGVVLGGVVSLAVADWDNVADYESWQAAINARSESQTERTARGYHVFYRGVDLVSSTGLGCEFKTRGVCMVSPSVHPSGMIYQVVNNAPIAIMDNGLACVLFPFLSKSRPAGKLSGGPGSVKTNASHLGHGVVAQIKQARPILDEMKAAGIKLHRGGKTTLVGLCLFHPDHSPSLWVNPESGLWGCNAPGCPASGTHDVINFRALQRGISNRDAIQQLTQEFLSSTVSVDHLYE